MIRQITHIEPNWGMEIGIAPLFEIRIIEERPQGLFVMGVAHSTVKLRQSLRQLRQYQPRELPDPVSGEGLLEMHLRIVQLQAYHNRLNRILTGMTAGVLLEGDYQSLLTCLQTHGWDHVDGQYHQWHDVSTVSKFILTS